MACGIKFTITRPNTDTPWVSDVFSGTTMNDFFVLFSDLEFIDNAAYHIPADADLSKINSISDAKALYESVGTTAPTDTVISNIAMYGTTALRDNAFDILTSTRASADIVDFLTTSGSTWEFEKIDW